MGGTLRDGVDGIGRRAEQQIEHVEPVQHLQAGIIARPPRCLRVDESAEDHLRPLCNPVDNFPQPLHQWTKAEHVTDRQDSAAGCREIGQRLSVIGIGCERFLHQDIGAANAMPD